MKPLPIKVAPPARGVRQREQAGARGIAAVVLALALGAGDLGGERGGASPADYPSVPVDLNLASEDELCLLPGIGPDRARRIVVHREIYGPVEGPGALDRVKGIGPVTATGLSGLVTASPPSR